MAKYIKKRIILLLISSTTVLAIILVCLLTKPERMYLSDNDKYSIVNILGTKIFFHNTGTSLLKLNLIYAGNKGILQINRLASHNNKYAVAVCTKEMKIYDHGKYVSGYRIDNGMEILSSFIDDYEGNGNDDIFLLLKKEGEEYGERLIILNFNGKNVNKTYDESFAKVNPWKVQVCDVDGDGQMEVSLGVYTVAKYHQVYAKRPFIYYFHDNKLYPKWLGSRLSQPFDDYVFCDMDSDKMDELISIETTSDGKKILNVYKWKGFGFESIGVSEVYDEMYGIKPDGRYVTAVCSEKKSKGQKIFEYSNGKIELRR